MRAIILVAVIISSCSAAFAAGNAIPLERLTKNVIAEGSCAVVGMSAEQSQLIALQRARAKAIEQVSGVAVSSSTLVVDFRLAADFIKTYSKGYIVRENREWLPLGQYQKDSASAPIPEYRVKVDVDVYAPQSKIPPIGLQAKADRTLYRNGETAQVIVSTKRKARIAIFNITANDESTMIFPNDRDRQSIAGPNASLLFPEKNSPTELVMQTLPGHDRDSEAFFVVALDAGSPGDFRDLFPVGKVMRLEEFFRRYAEISDRAEDTIVTYEISQGAAP